MLSEESILDLWSPGRPTLGKNKVIAFARAIEREAYKQGQEAMRERAANLADQVGLDWERVGDMQKVYATEYLSELFRDLEIEEPK